MARRAVVLALLVVCAGCTAAVSSTTTTRSEATTSTAGMTPATESTLEDMIGRWDLAEYFEAGEMTWTLGDAEMVFIR